MRLPLSVLSVPAVLLLAGAARAQEAPPEVPDRPFLGLQTEEFSENGKVAGIRVSYIFPFSTAAEMDFQLGDVVYALNDVILTNRDTFVNEVRRNNIGGKMRFLVRREGKLLKTEGKIGSYLKTMKAFEESLRARFAGKPLPAPPAALWWSPETKSWREKDSPLDGLGGKITVVFSFDGCEHCREWRFAKMVQTQALIGASDQGESLAFVGIYFAEALDKEKSQAELEKLLGEMPAPVKFPVGIAYYPAAAATPAERETHALLHNHGVAILDTDAHVSYYQIVGVPGPEFGLAYQKALLELGKGAQPAAGDKPKPKAPAPPPKGE
jgi:hypothetical protein